MAFSWDNKNAPTKFSWQTQGLGATKEQKIATEKQDLVAKGIPVSTKADRLEPTMDGNILRGAAKLIATPATNLVNAGQIALGKKETKPFSGGYLGKVEGLGKLDMTKGLTPENVKTLKKSGSTGFEIASYLTYGGIGKGAIKEIVKQRVKEFAKTQGAKLLKEGALTGLANTIGTQGFKNAETGKKFSWQQAARDVTLSTVATPLAAFGLNKAFGKSAKQVVDNIPTPTQKIVSNIDNTVENSLSKSATGVRDKSLTYLRNNPDEVINGEVKLREVDGKVVIEDGRHRLQVAKELGITPKFKDVTPEYTGKPSKQIESLINEQQVKEVANSPVTETPIPASIPKDAIPEFKAKVDYGAKVLDDVNPESANKGNHKLYSETVYGDIAKDPERVKRIAMGSGEATTNGVPADAYYAIMKNEAAKSGNVKLIKELSNSNVGTISGKKLEANKLTQEGDIVDTVRDIYKARAKAVGVSEEALKRNEKTLVEKLKSEVKVMLDKIPTKQEMNDIINSLVCK